MMFSFVADLIRAKMQYVYWKNLSLKKARLKYEPVLASLPQGLDDCKP